MVNTLVKLIVSDMDGTLVDDDKNIDPEIFGLLPKLKAAVKELLWFVTDDYNRRNGTAHNSRLISVVLTKYLR